MEKRHFLGAMIAFILIVGLTIHPAGAAYPDKAIEMIIHMGPGSAPDIEGRVFATEMSKILGKPVVPINKEGGGGAVAYTHVKNAKPDGYTIAWNSMSILSCTNIGNVPFDYDALDQIGQVMTQPMWFTVKGDAKWKTLQEFVADAKKNPGKLKVANAGTGSSTHLAALALAQFAGIEVQGTCSPKSHYPWRDAVFPPLPGRWRKCLGMVQKKWTQVKVHIVTSQKQLVNGTAKQNAAAADCKRLQ